jgi:hypothetical protein
LLKLTQLDKKPSFNDTIDEFNSMDSLNEEHSDKKLFLIEFKFCRLIPLLNLEHLFKKSRPIAVIFFKSNS